MSLERAAAYVGFGPTKFKELIEESKMPKAIDVDGLHGGTASIWMLRSMILRIRGVIRLNAVGTGWKRS
jgi:hypothetical protein